MPLGDLIAVNFFGHFGVRTFAPTFLLSAHGLLAGLEPMGASPMRRCVGLIFRVAVPAVSVLMVEFHLLPMPTGGVGSSSLPSI